MSSMCRNAGSGYHNQDNQVTQDCVWATACEPRNAQLHTPTAGSSIIPALAKPASPCKYYLHAAPINMYPQKIQDKRSTESSWWDAQLIALCLAAATCLLRNDTILTLLRSQIQQERKGVNKVFGSKEPIHKEVYGLSSPIRVDLCKWKLCYHAPLSMSLPTQTRRIPYNWLFLR